MKQRKRVIMHKGVGYSNSFANLLVYLKNAQRAKEAFTSEKLS